MRYAAYELWTSKLVISGTGKDAATHEKEGSEFVEADGSRIPL